MTSNRACCNYIVDNPLKNEEDSHFEAHHRIANEIACMINSEQASSIAIIGDLGSGKSTVLEFVKDKISDKSIKYVSFDAWVHAGDSLRKAFFLLLGDVVYGDSSEWNQKKRVLEGTETVETRLEETQYSVFTIWLFLLLGFFLISQVIVSVINEAVPEWLLSVMPSNQLVGTNPQSPLVILLPPTASLILATIIAVVLFVARAFKRKEELFLEQRKRMSVFEEGISLIVKRPGGVVKQTVKHLPDIDSLEFEKLYLQLLSHCEKKKYKLVIAIDNLDRLAGTDIKTAWDTIQLFTGRTLGPDGVVARPWVLLPISRSAFGCLSDADDSDVARLNALSKFAVRQFEIPAPITTDWKDSFAKYLTKAFGEIGQEEIAIVFDIIESRQQNKNYRTPRETIRFINEMVSMKRIHPHISYPSIALYCFGSADLRGEESAQRHHNALSNPRSIEHSIIKRWNLDYELTLDELSMQTYGVFSRTEAHEIFVSSEIEKILNAKESTLLEQAYRRPGIWNAIQGSLEARMRGTTMHTDRMCALVRYFFPGEVDGYDRPYDLMSIQRLLLDNISKAKWPIYDGCAEDIRDALSRNPNAVSLVLDHALAVKSFDLNSDDILNEENDSSTSFALWASESLPIINMAVIAKPGSKVDLPVLGERYQDFLLQIANSSYTYEWLVHTEEESASAFISILSGLLIMSSKQIDDLPSAFWNVLSFAPPITSDSDEQVDYSGIKTDEAREVQLDLLMWSLRYIHNINSPRIDNYLELQNVNETYSKFWLSPFDENSIEIRTMVISNLLHQLDEEWARDRLLAIIDETSDYSPFLELRRIIPDSFKTTISILHDDEFQNIAAGLFSAMLTDDDYKQLSFEHFIRYSLLISGKRGLGILLAKANRLTDLLESDFERNQKALYAGFTTVISDPKLVTWVIKGLYRESIDSWVEWLQKENSVSVELAKYCKKVPPNLTRAIISIIDTHSYSLPLQLSELIQHFEDTSLLFASFDNLFLEPGLHWRNIVDAGINIEVYAQWFVHLNNAGRAEVFKNIVDTNTKKYIVWLLSLLQCFDDPKALLRNHLTRVKDVLARGANRQSMPKKARPVCVQIAKLLGLRVKIR